MKINTKRIRGGDYVEGVSHPANRIINVSGIVTNVDEINKLVHIQGRNYTAMIYWDKISQYISVSHVVFADINLAQRVLTAKNRMNNIWEIYDRKKKQPKKDRYKIVRKLGK